MIFVTVIEPKPLLRLGIMHLLSKVDTSLSLAGYDPPQLLHQVPTQSCDLVILSVPEGDGLAQVTQQVERIFSPKAILLLYDAFENPPMPYATPSHIVGCVYKHTTPEILLASVQLVLAGGNCFPNGSWSENTLLALSVPTKFEDLSTCCESEMLGLTPRQYEVLVLLAKGYPIKTVGRQLNISVATAKAHAESLYHRLDVRNRNAAVYAAIARGANLGWSSIPCQDEGGDPAP